MTTTSRELVLQTLNRTGPARAPRELWVLPIATETYPEEYAGILRDYPSDFQVIGGSEREQARSQGDPYRVGDYVDPWGCTFTNIQPGVIGEVKDPLVKDWKTDGKKIHIPREWLTIDRDAVARDCAGTEKFTAAGRCPRPFEQLQFIRGTTDLFLDLAEPPPQLRTFMREMHHFYTELLSTWAQTDVDSLRFMDDGGSQQSLLIAPAMWREHFKPLYRDFAQIAHASGKKIFMHSDGHILSILPDLIEIGIDAINSQIFCMGVESLKPFAGRITFWGEMDRQRLLPRGSIEEIDRAVRSVHTHLWANGGGIAQCEFGAAAKPGNVRQVFASWDALSAPEMDRSKK